MRDRPNQILASGTAGSDGPRGVVVRYPRSADYFRRALARISVDHGAGDPAAQLLAMTRRILAPGQDMAMPAALRAGK